jgi:hypothetical protein
MIHNMLCHRLPKSASLQATFMGKSALCCTIINESSFARAMPHFRQMGASAMDCLGLHVFGGEHRHLQPWQQRCSWLETLVKLGEPESSRRVIL